ncbi:CinA family protein [uncultured Chitinophaga sp.]|uniref:CinA family protein n=1 Tax=uncultured Chitinophaga sp. TaxID=339340 RepID=UPI0025CC6EFE|nr:CinA family protein [uncultured Chitinophaga sp.]
MKNFNENELKKIGARLLNRHETIAVAESVTAGLLQYAFSNIPDASGFFQGGITAYNLGQKFKHLSVEPVHALEVNCVSQKVADQMALAVAGSFAGHWGIGVTGYATPTPESGDKVFAYYAISHLGEIKASGIIKPAKQDPPALQLIYTNKIIQKFYSLLK